MGPVIRTSNLGGTKKKTCDVFAWWFRQEGSTSVENSTLFKVLIDPGILIFPLCYFNDRYSQEKATVMIFPSWEKLIISAERKTPSLFNCIA